MENTKMEKFDYGFIVKFNPCSTKQEREDLMEYILKKEYIESIQGTIIFKLKKRMK